MQKQSAAVFTSGQAAKAVNITQRQLDHWATQGIVVPSIEEGRGFGGVRAYSLSDVVSLEIVSRMKASGFALRQLQTLAQAIQKWEEGSETTWFIGSEDGVIESFVEKEAIRRLRSMDRKGLTWFINIDDAIVDVKTKLSDAPRSSRGKPLRLA